MAGKQLSNDELIARARAGDDEILEGFQSRAGNFWRMIWLLVTGLALIVATNAAAIFSGHAALVTGLWGRIVTGAVLVALFVFYFVTTARNSLRPDKTDSARLAQMRLDHYQRARRWSILINVVAMSFVLGIPPALAIMRAAHLLPLLIGAAALVAGILIINVFLLSAGPGWQTLAPPGLREIPNDEFDVALRARTMRFGYVLVMLLLGAVLPVALWRPDLTLTAIAWALYAGFAVPALYYLIADWRASGAIEG